MGHFKENISLPVHKNQEVYILGEQGVGKSNLVGKIHAHAKKIDKPNINTVNTSDYDITEYLTRYYKSFLGYYGNTPCFKQVQSLFRNLIGEDFYLDKNTTTCLNRLSACQSYIVYMVFELMCNEADEYNACNSLVDFNITAVVDDFGNHAHPLVQIKLMRVLRQYFPRIQWIVTTNSPLVINGASKGSIAFKLYNDGGVVKVSDTYELDGFSNRTLNSVVTSSLFNLPTARPATFQGTEHDLETGDYLYTLIHRKVKEQMKSKPLQDTEIQDMISELLEEFENENKI